jgi:hypothetical protein
VVLSINIYLIAHHARKKTKDGLSAKIISKKNMLSVLIVKEKAKELSAILIASDVTEAVKFPSKRLEKKK